METDPGEGKRSYILRLWAHPAARERGLERVLIERLIGMVRENEARPDLQPANSVPINAATRDDKPGRRELFEDLGMTVAREFWQMARPLDRPVDEPAAVPGVTIRAYRRPEDNAGATAAYNDSFRDHWDHHDSTVESWDHAISAPSRRPDLSWIAEIDGEPGNFGGFCLCVIHEPDNLRTGRKEGWIELLGTTRAWRGKGLGKSLLLHGLRSLKSAGLDIALLGVDSTSPTGANKLYESAGFTVRHRDTIYCRDLSEFQL
jgi:mycothiol synthase